MAVNETHAKAYFERMTDEQKQDILKVAKGGLWYEGWRPYCTQTVTPCDSRLTRMSLTSFGFRCNHCGNEVGFDLIRVNESPLNIK